jgi:hypothetical protein
VALNARLVGREVDVLVDAASRRRDDRALRPHDAQRRGQPAGPADVDRPDAPVRVERAGPHSVWGIEVGRDLTGAPSAPRL